jgi:hypothetical protein
MWREGVMRQRGRNAALSVQMLCSSLLVAFAPPQNKILLMCQTNIENRKSGNLHSFDIKIFLMLPTCFDFFIL